MQIAKLGTVLALVLAALSISGDGSALERQSNGYYRTGEAIVRHKVLVVTVTVLAIAHEMKALPPVRSKQAVIDLDVGKRFALQMRRDIPSDKMREGLAEGYAKHGYRDQAKVAKLLSVLKGELKDNSWLLITYDADKKTTTMSIPGGPSSTVPGVDFMRATWQLWLAGDDASLGDALIKHLPGSGGREG
jgi:hypothetical protein